MPTEPRGQRTAELAQLIASCPWLLNVLTTVREAGPPDAWVGAGVLRDLVWGQRYGGGFNPREVRDVDVAFFDANDLTPDNDLAATNHLRLHEPTVPWEATNRAAVHTWYESVFGTGPVDALRPIADAVATWPETATCVRPLAPQTWPGPVWLVHHRLRSLPSGRVLTIVSHVERRQEDT